MVGENRVSLSHTNHMFSSGPYVHRVTTGRTFDTTLYIRYVGSQGEPHFLSIIHLFSDS
jgi:hypothetical protein